LTVRENLVLFLPPGAKSRQDIAAGIDAFPILGKRLSQTAGSLSGGEQQMLAVAKAFLCQPKVVMADELSLGLAPLIIDEIYASLRKLSDEGITLLIVEQYVHRIIGFADDVHVLSRGRLSWSGAAAEVDEESLISKYLGEDPAAVASGGLRDAQ
jgi:branched-chain amino acid transport system ATP-binding protein